MTAVIQAELPFDRSQNEISISQGFDGPYSHNHFSIRTVDYDLRYALDFVLPLGTQILAARKGIVRYIFNGRGYYEGSDPIEGRKVVAASAVLAHTDITGFPATVYSMYQHFDPESLQVGVGQTVESGQPLAKTGRSGWIGENPHLHLHFQYHANRPGKGPIVSTIPFVLNGYKGELDDTKNMQNLVGDSREFARKILAIRKRDGFTY